jgi:hypothetical protein
VDYIKIYLKETEYKDVVWMGAGSSEHGNERIVSIKAGHILTR